MTHNPAKRTLDRVGWLCALMKWGEYGLMRFSGQVDCGMSWRGALPQPQPMNLSTTSGITPRNTPYRD
jgi:hypothetical protein